MSPKATYSKNSFTQGEISPEALGRYDLDQYQNAVKKLENFVINQLGGVSFRPGTYYTAVTKTTTGTARLIPFIFSVSQSYVIEMGELYFRYYTNNAQLVSGTPVETVTPYAASEVFDVQYTQSADVMYLTHRSYQPRKLTRASASSFGISAVNFIRGPFLDTNITATTITPSADTGTSITIAASASIFVSQHVGALFRVKDGVVKVTTYTSATALNGDVQAEPDGTAGNLGTGPAATTDWAEGAFSDYRGWPKCCVFHDQRLWYASTATEPLKLWGSVLRAYNNFDAGSAADDDAVTYEIASDQANAIQWLSSGARQLFIGTLGAIFTAAGDVSSIITPSAVTVDREIGSGVDDIRPWDIGSYLYCVRRDLNRLLEVGYSLDTDGQEGDDMMLLADHIFKEGNGVIDTARQQTPNTRIWAVRSDGEIAILTRHKQQLVQGWSRVVAGTDLRDKGTFESIAVIPRSEDDDQVWVIVKRYINGQYVKYVEFFTDEDFDDDFDAVRLDSALTLDSPKTITHVSAANPVVITATSHGFSNNDQVRIDNVVGTTQVNSKVFKATAVSAHTFALTDTDGVAIDGSAYSSYISNGEARKMVTAISGLSHLEGELVSVIADGGIPADTQKYTVASGAITLIRAAAVVHAGLPYTGDIRLLKLSDGSPTGTGQTKDRRIYLSSLRLYRSLGLKIGRDADKLETPSFSSPGDAIGIPPALFTGDITERFRATWRKDDEVIIQQQQPLPLTILSVVLRSEVNEI